MANVLQRTDAILEYTLAEFINHLGFAQTAYRGIEADFRDYKNLALGDTVRIRKPVRHGVADGLTSVVQDTIERDASITIDQSHNTTFTFDTEELALYAVEEFYNQYLRNDVQVMASKVDAYLARQLDYGVYHSLGEAGTPVASDTVFSEAESLATYLGIPQDPRYVGISPTQYHTMRSGMKGYFNPSLNDNIIYRGNTGSLYGFDFHENQNTPIHTAGKGEDLAIANGVRACGAIKIAVIDGATVITLKGLTPSDTGVLKKGDVLRIPAQVGGTAINKVNEVTKNIVPYPVEVVVQDDYDADTNGDINVNILPALNYVATNPYQNISEQIAIDAPVYLVAAPLATDDTVSAPFTSNIAYFEDALFLCVPPLPPLRGLAYSRTITDSDTNISMRLSHMSEILNSNYFWKLEVLYGGLVNGEYAIKVNG